MNALEMILAFLSAVIVIFAANFLVKKQNKKHQHTATLENEATTSLEELELSVSILLNENPDEFTLVYLEQRMDKLLKCLRLVKKPKYKEKIYHAHHKKSFADD